MEGRVNLSAKEAPFYQTLYSMAGPDLSGSVSGARGSEFLQHSGLSREILHSIWSISDANQEGKLSMDRFFVAMRLIAHAQSGTQPAAALVHIVPPVLPIFEGLSNRKRETISEVPQFGDSLLTGALPQPSELAPMSQVDITRTAELSLSLQQLGLDALTFAPFASGPLTPRNSSTGWTLNEAEKRKYSELFAQIDISKNGLIDGRTARHVLERSKLSKTLLAMVWELADIGKDGKLNHTEFLCAMHLASKAKKGYPLPSTLPAELSDLFIEKKTTESKKIPSDPVTASEPLNIDNMSVEQVQKETEKLSKILDDRKLLCRSLKQQYEELEDKLKLLQEKRKSVTVSKIAEKRDKAQLQLHNDQLTAQIKESIDELKELEDHNKSLIAHIAEIDRELPVLETQRKELADKLERESQSLRQETEMDNRNQAVEEQRVREEISRSNLKSVADARERSLRDLRSLPKVTESEARQQGNTWASSLVKNAIPETCKKSGFGASFFNDKAR